MTLLFYTPSPPPLPPLHYSFMLSGELLVHVPLNLRLKFVLRLFSANIALM